MSKVIANIKVEGNESYYNDVSESREFDCKLIEECTVIGTYWRVVTETPHSFRDREFDDLAKAREYFTSECENCVNCM